MPRTSVDYSKTIIYKIQHKENPELLYIGSSTNFTQRKNQHKNNCYNEKRRHYNLKLYQTIRENGGWECFNMIEIKKYPCNDNNEARAEEDRIMREMKSNMNSVRAYRTSKQYYEDTKEQQKLYRELNKEKISERRRLYRIDNQEKIREQDRQKYKDNKEKICEIRKQYYIDNEEKIKENRKQSVVCECGCEVRRVCLTRHKKSKKHIDLMNSKCL